MSSVQKTVSARGLGKAFAWVLVSVALVGVIASPFIPGQVIAAYKFVLPVSVLLAAAGLVFGQISRIEQTEEAESKFYLVKSLEAFNRAASLLDDGNNNRATWILAGRALRLADRLSSRISVPMHLEVFELERLHLRGIFNGFIAEQPPAFFYGVQDTTVSVDQAATQSSEGETVAGRRRVSTVRGLEERSLRTIWQFAQYPHDWDDPIGDRFTDEERGQLMVLHPGLHEYLEHTAQWHSAAGRLYSRAPPHAR